MGYRSERVFSWVNIKIVVWRVLAGARQKEAPQSGGYCGAKGFGLFLGGKDELPCS
jgi:hypothetical protein